MNVAKSDTEDVLDLVNEEDNAEKISTKRGRPKL